MKPLKLNEEVIEKGSYKIVVEYYDNDDLVVTVYDTFDNSLLGYIDIVDEAETDLGINWN